MEKRVFQANGVGANGLKKKKKNLNLLSYANISSKWITNLNAKCKTTKFLEKALDGVAQCTECRPAN